VAAARVHLRPTSIDDREEFVSSMRASRKLHRPWLYPPTTSEAFDLMLARDRESFFPLVICRTGDGAIVGFFNISGVIRGGFQSAFVGYGGVAGFAGHGYMTEGMRLMLRHAFVEIGLHRVEANIQPGNEASIALVKRCGFVREGFSQRYLKVGGRWRDHERWAIRVEQWRAGDGGALR